MKNKPVMVFLIFVGLILAKLITSFLGPDAPFALWPQYGIFKRNNRGTYDRYIIWPLGNGTARNDSVAPERNCP